jgi:hypothetical protein
MGVARSAVISEVLDGGVVGSFGIGSSDGMNVV